MRAREVKKATLILKAIQKVIINHRVYFPKMIYKKVMVNINFLIELMEIERDINKRIYSRNKENKDE